MDSIKATEFATEVLENEFAGQWTINSIEESSWLGWTTYEFEASSDLDETVTGSIEEYLPGSFRTNLTDVNAVAV